MLEPGGFAADQAAWRTLLGAANSWRGECLHHFTTVEHAVTETLLRFDAAKPGTVRLRHLIGQRLEDLALILREDAPFAHPRAAKALALFRERHEAFRTLLCHGHLAVNMDIKGRWLVVARTLSIRARQGAEAIAVIPQAEGEERLAGLKRDGQALTALLGQVRKGAGES